MYLHPLLLAFRYGAAAAASESKVRIPGRGTLISTRWIDEPRTEERDGLGGRAFGTLLATSCPLCPSFLSVMLHLSSPSQTLLIRSTLSGSFLPFPLLLLSLSHSHPHSQYNAPSDLSAFTITTSSDSNKENDPHPVDDTRPSRPHSPPPAVAAFLIISTHLRYATSLSHRLAPAHPLPQVSLYRTDEFHRQTHCSPLLLLDQRPPRTEPPIQQDVTSPILQATNYPRTRLEPKPYLVLLGRRQTCGLVAFRIDLHKHSTSWLPR